MKDSIITTERKLEQLVLHLEASTKMGAGGIAQSPDRFITGLDKELISIAKLTKAPIFAPWLIRLLKLTQKSSMSKLVMEALTAVGEPVVEELTGLLDTEHGPRAALVLSDIGQPSSLGPIIQRAGYFPGYLSPAVKICRKVGGDKAIEFLIETLIAHKPFGFPKNLTNKVENETRKAVSSMASSALKEITGEDLNSADQWQEWNRGKG